VVKCLLDRASSFGRIARQGGAIVWNLVTWWLGIPSSSSHALIGGLLGAGIAKAGLAAVVWGGVLATGLPPLEVIHPH
jgi:phosphate/sulfate permease